LRRVDVGRNHGCEQHEAAAAIVITVSRFLGGLIGEVGGDTLDGRASDGAITDYGVFIMEVLGGDSVYVEQLLGLDFFSAEDGDEVGAVGEGGGS
jgi:hypothetical protein